MARWPRSAPVPATLGRRAGHRGQGRHRTGGRHHRQGRTRSTCSATRTARRPPSSSATTSPTRRRSRVLQGPDLGVKVGAGDSARRVPGVDAPKTWPRRWRSCSRSGAPGCPGRRAPPIERLTMLASPRTVALADPRRDPHLAVSSRTRLGRGVRASARRHRRRPLHRRPAPRAALPLSQRYVDGTMTVRDPLGRACTVTDYLPHDVRAGPHRPDPGDQRVRPRAVVTFAPRPEFGQVPGQPRGGADGLRVHGTNEPIVLRSPGVQWDDHVRRHPADRACRRRPVRAATSSSNCAAAPKNSDRPRRREPERRRAGRVVLVATGPTSLHPARRCKPDLMKRSALTLRGLVHADSGAILAAATTSLPEEIGGVRNWDYRYCWLRDAALTAPRSSSLGSLSEAEDFLDWVHGVLETLPGPSACTRCTRCYGAACRPRRSSTRCPATRARGRCASATRRNQQVQLDVFGPDRRPRSAPGRRPRDAGLTEATLTDADWELVQRHGRRGRAPLARTRPRHLGDPRQPAPPRVLEGDVLGDRRPGADAGRALRPRSRARTGRRCATRSPTRCSSKGWNDERPVVHRRLRRHRPRRGDPAHRAVRADRPVRPAVRRDRHGHRGGAAQRLDRVPVPPRRRPARRRGRLPPLRCVAGRGVPADRAALARPRRCSRNWSTPPGPTGLLSEEYDPVAERSLGNHPQAYSHLGLLRCAQLLA